MSSVSPATEVLAGGAALAAIYYVGTTLLKNYALCPRRSQYDIVDNLDLRLGRYRHALLEQYFMGNMADLSLGSLITYGQIDSSLDRYKLTPEQVLPSLQALNRHWVAGVFPSRDTVIAVEGHGIPKKYRHEEPNKNVEGGTRSLFRVALAEDVGIQTAMDLVCEDPKDEGVLRMPDWKWMHQAEDILQAFMCAVSASIIWPGYREYRFETVHLGFPRPKRTPYALTVKDVTDARAYLVGLLRRIRDDKTHVAKVNEHCGKCPIREGCGPYLEVTGQPLAPTVKAVKALEVPAETPKIIELWQRAKLVERVAEARKEQLDARLKVELKDNPCQWNGKEYFLGEHKGKYKADKDRIMALAGKAGIPPPAFLSVDADLFEGEFSALPDVVREPLQKEFDACFEQQVSPSIKERAIK